MRSLHSPALLAAALALAACADQSPVTARAPEAAPLMSVASGQGVAGSYVVVLKDGAPHSVSPVLTRTP